MGSPIWLPVWSAFLVRKKMSKSFIDVVQDSYRTVLGLVLKPETPSIEPFHRPRDHLVALNFTSDWFRLIIAYEFSVLRLPGTHPHLYTPVGSGPRNRARPESMFPDPTRWSKPPGTRNRECRPREWFPSLALPLFFHAQPFKASFSELLPENPRTS